MFSVFCHYSKHFTNIYPFNPHKPPRGAISPFYEWTNWGTIWLYNLSKVIELIQFKSQLTEIKLRQSVTSTTILITNLIIQSSEVWSMMETIYHRFLTFSHLLKQRHNSLCSYLLFQRCLCSEQPLEDGVVVSVEQKTDIITAHYKRFKLREPRVPLL